MAAFVEDAEYFKCPKSDATHNYCVVIRNMKPRYYRKLMCRYCYRNYGYYKMPCCGKLERFDSWTEEYKNCYECLIKEDIEIYQNFIQTFLHRKALKLNRRYNIRTMKLEYYQYEISKLKLKLPRVLCELISQYIVFDWSTQFNFL